MSVTQAIGSHFSIHSTHTAKFKKYGRLAALALMCLAHLGTQAAAQNVVMQHNDIGRTEYERNDSDARKRK
jgi:hypothetical protein